MKTKKVGLAGKYGTRYGRVIRQKVLSASGERRYKCSNCLRPSVRRLSAGIWECGKCGHKFSGKAYKPQ